MKKALLSIDYTVDFVAEDGALTCSKPGQDIEDSITAITREFIEEQHFVVFAIDSHRKGDQYHPETNLFPPHNIIGTPGRDLFGSLKFLYEKHQHEEHVYWMDKTRYSAFAGTDLEQKLRERGITELHLTGVCTDICILHTAVDAYNKGFQLVIHKNAVASFNPLGHDWALQHFTSSMGAKVV
ncbi:cysteine hydrolase family protein [Bacillus tuaregi]|uniref:cysteine hydrolase family protein n=1 Tax=Bacillus tuaregi TaxID=1816695 RepID=UPI0008F91A8C|nr:isochorismatase family cysteine hydrolase [Bacillus tuaregi]